MPLLLHGRRQIVFKVVYFGPGFGGKTSNLRYVHAHSATDKRGKLISIDSGSQRTLFLDFLPVKLGAFRGYGVGVHLCSVPGQIAQEHTRQLVLRHVDAVVFVADSQAGRIESNQYSFRDLSDLLDANGMDPARTPLVMQYNKRDLPGCLSVEALRDALKVPRDVPQVEASATEGFGVFETLKVAVTTCMKAIGDPRSRPEGHSHTELAYPHERYVATPSESMVRQLRPADESAMQDSGASSAENDRSEAHQERPTTAARGATKG